MTFCKPRHVFFIFHAVFLIMYYTTNNILCKAFLLFFSRIFIIFFFFKHLPPVFGGCAALLFLELSHKIRIALIAAPLGDFTYRKLRIYKEFSRINESALYNVLKEGNTEGIEVDTVEIGLADMHFLANPIHGPVVQRIIKNAVPERFKT